MSLNALDLAINEKEYHIKQHIRPSINSDQILDNTCTIQYLLCW